MKVTATEAIGWLSALVLTVSMGHQTYTQWKRGTSRGISKWLYIGGIVNASGFVAYSWLVRNWVFVASNCVMVVTNIVGVSLTLHHRRKEKRREAKAAA